MLILPNHMSGNRERGRIVAAERYRRTGMTNGGGSILLAQPAAGEALVVAPGQTRQRTGITRLERERLFEQGDRPLGFLWHRDVDERLSLQHKIIGIEAVGPFALDALDLSSPEARLDGADHAHCDLVLHRKDVVERPVIALGPEMIAGLRLDELA